MKTARFVTHRAIAFSLVAHLVLGCAQQPELVHFVLPAGFRGPIGIVVNQPNGIALQKIGPRFEIRIPKDGKITIRGFGPFSCYRLSASFETNETIPVATPAMRKEANAIVLWELPTRAHFVEEMPVNTHQWFVGTASEREKHQSSRPEKKE